MGILNSLGAHWRVGAAYFVAASATVAFTRSAGSVATLWIATGLLVGVLIHQPRRRWPAILCAAGLASALATALLGFGPAAAVPFALVNMAEALVGAAVFRRIGEGERETLKSTRWVFRLFVSVGVAGPLVGAVPAALIAAAHGQSFGISLLLYLTGHSMGSITVTPLALTIAHRRARRESFAAFRIDWQKKCLLLGSVAATASVVFSQNTLPLLFLPVLPMIIATFRCGRETAALSVVLLALIGGTTTMTGHGPIFLMGGDPLTRMLFFQFYLAATVLTTLPVAADLHAKRAILRAIAFSEERFRLIAEHSTDILLQLDVDGRVRYVSPSIRTIGGYDPDALLGRPINILIEPEWIEESVAHHLEVMRDPSATRSFEYRARLTDGAFRWFETHARAIVGDDGRVEGTVSIIRDIQNRKEMEQRLTQAAFTDPLTGIPNRRAFRDQAELRLAEPGRRRDCVAIFDIDHFKRVNDLFGHDIGDLLLQHFAKVARALLRQEDFFARFGGEEFVVLLPDVDVQEAFAVCERLRREVALTPLCVNKQVVRLTVSGGVARLGADGLDSALKIADLALYEAKAGGRDQLALAA